MAQQFLLDKYQSDFLSIYALLLTCFGQRQFILSQMNKSAFPSVNSLKLFHSIKDYCTEKPFTLIVLFITQTA